MASRVLLALALATALFRDTAGALEIYNFINDSGEHNSGFVLAIDNTNLTLLSLEGRLLVIPAARVTALYVYNIVQNPLMVLHLDSQMAQYLRNVYLSDADQPSFAGFPLHTTDDMVIFFDLDGKIHVHVLPDVVKLRAYEFTGDVDIPFETYEEIVLMTDSHDRREGSASSPSALPVYATRVFKGQISIHKYFTTARSNFNRISSYQERTYLYARPLIFDQDFKLGNTFLFRKFGFKERNLSNIYLQWATGSAYRFQSKTIVGAASSEWLPELFPMGIIQSEVKTHFFNTLFVGNLDLAALPAGNRKYTSVGDSSASGGDLLYSYDPYVEINFNYMLLLGGDYGPYSASLGMFYPVYGIEVGDHMREITAPKTSPALRFVYMKGKVKFKTIAALTRYGGNNADASKNVFARFWGNTDSTGTTDAVDTVAHDDFGYWYYEDDRTTPIEQYSLNSEYIRIGLAYNIAANLEVGADILVVSGNYDEVFVNYDAPQSIKYHNTVDFEHYNAGVYLHHRFSDYVALKGVVNYYYNIYEYDFFRRAGRDSLPKCEYGGAFELIF